jgi:hypothetical protein
MEFDTLRFHVNGAERCFCEAVRWDGVSEP